VRRAVGIHGARHVHVVEVGLQRFGDEHAQAFVRALADFDDTGGERGAAVLGEVQHRAGVGEGGDGRRLPEAGDALGADLAVGQDDAMGLRIPREAFAHLGEAAGQVAGVFVHRRAGGREVACADGVFRRRSAGSIFRRSARRSMARSVA
jgi:hypothetical protein